MNNLSNEKIKGLVYHADFEIIEKFYNSEKFIYKSDIETTLPYKEYVISYVDLKNNLSHMIEAVQSVEFDIEKKLSELSAKTARVIYNDNKKCMFILTSNIDKWRDIANQLNLKEYNLLDSYTIDKIKKGDLKNIYEIEIELEEDDSEYLINLRGFSIWDSSEDMDLLIKAKEIVKYKRKFENYDIEVGNGNYVEIYRVLGEFNLNKSLSKSVFRR
ncbi:hypothetical protein SANA_25310 [Gottschalkiaceae bacterium SANA]|nr:hypothetical protein SANA_25310 [Gottschalkiaceae bacterium SANA]